MGHSNEHSAMDILFYIQKVDFAVIVAHARLDICKHYSTNM